MISVIIPAYNEEKIIEAIINKVNNLAIDKEIIVINDCSKDRTELILKSISLNNLKVIHHASKRGKGAAVRTGLENAIGEFIVIQDADKECNLDNYLKLLEVIKNQGADIALGWQPGKLSLKNIFLSIMFGVKLNNWFSHCQFVRRESLLKLLPDLKDDNIAFEILTKAVRNKMRVVEVPIICE